MPIYISHRAKILLYNNYKCIYSTLYHILTKDPTIIYHEGPLSNPSQFVDYTHVIITRDPKSRIESIYRDKIINTLRLQSLSHRQTCQQLLQRALDSTPNIKTRIIRDISFQEFVKLLPQVVFSDPHFMPQNLILGAYPLKIEEIIKMEASNWISRVLFWINKMLINPVKYLSNNNSTEHISADTTWDDDTTTILFDLYHKDYTTFGYER